MLFSKWKTYPRRKPKSDGFYLCTIDIDGQVENRYIVKLYYSVRANTWSDISRQKMFEGYVVYKCCRAPIPDNRVYTDSLCDRTSEVIAWRKMPGVCERKGVNIKRDE